MFSHALTLAIESNHNNYVLSCTKCIYFVFFFQDLTIGCYWAHKVDELTYILFQSCNAARLLVHIFDMA